MKMKRILKQIKVTPARRLLAARYAQAEKDNDTAN